MSAGVTRRVLIPAAGFGKRVGSPPAKELFIDQESGEPLIQYSLRCAALCAAAPLVIVRKDKLELIDYLREKGIEMQLIERSEEWPDTLLQSEALWAEHNVVILPDSKFEPREVAKEMFEYMARGSRLVFAKFSPPEFNTWGCIGRQGTRWCSCEKPAQVEEIDDLIAWGLFGFARGEGMELLSSMLRTTRTHRWEALACVPALVPLQSFVDCTR